MDLGKNRKNLIAGITSLGIHAILLLLFLFLISWKAPNPPLSALGGIELNFGLDEVGFGDTQPTSPVGANNPQDAVEPERSSVVEDNNVPEPDKQTETLTSTVEEDAVEVKDNPKIKKDLSNRAEIENVKTDKKLTEVKPTEEVKTPEQPVKKGTSGNHGDDKGKIGDKGSAQGTLDANALYGNLGTGGQGGAGVGGGFALQMAGWNWDEQPKAPKLPDNENGRVVFEIEVDEEGEITSIKTLERSLSAEAEKICKQEVLRRSLIKTSQGTAPERSKGRVAFVLRTQ